MSSPQAVGGDPAFVIVESPAAIQPLRHSSESWNPACIFIESPSAILNRYGAVRAPRARRFLLFRPKEIGERKGRPGAASLRLRFSGKSGSLANSLAAKN
jgi:hypothetical protein